MTSKKELKLAYYFAGVLLFVGAISYAAFPVQQPEEPVRVMFESVSGKVLFTHKTHAADAGYGIACQECHHHPEEDDVDLRACKDCHQVPQEDQPVSQACLDCHSDGEVDDTEMVKTSDAFHSQCIGCHEDYGEGPQECSACHVL
jgi:hypothetical protein